MAGILGGSNMNQNMYVNVLIDRSNSKLDKAFTYKAPKNMIDKVQIGKRVLIPFGPKNNQENGYIIEKLSHINIKNQIKEITDIIDDFPLFDYNVLNLANFIKQKYMCNMIDTINTILPAGVRNTDIDNNMEKYFRIKISKEEAEEFIKINQDKYKAQVRVLNYLIQNLEAKLSDIKDNLGITDSAIKTLLKNGIIEELKKEKNIDIYTDTHYIEKNSVLNNEQIDAINIIKQKFYERAFYEILLYGVTGSGKTEVYIEVIKQVIKNGKQAIVLVPEIALTPQIVRRFREHFNEDVVVMHSRLSDTEKYNQWSRVKRKDVSVMIGPRSAIFAPFNDIGLIIIDEEHELTYKSESTPKYDAKEVARFICRNNNAVLIYGSATPAVETYYRAEMGEVDIINLTKRVNEAEQPVIHIVDMKKELKEGNMTIISREVHKKIQQKLKLGEQVLIFINRRGFSTFVSCRKCGHVMKCDNCEMPYVYHYNTDTLSCHHCGKLIKNVNICPACNSKYIKFFGIGTEKVEDEIKSMFSWARILRMDADTTTKKNSHDNILTNFNEGNADILIGTQMIAKGHDFKNVTLVVVLAADMSLNIQNFRAYERSFQLFTQLAGRAGRTGTKSEVYIQTYEEKNYVLECVKNYDYQGFYKKEILLRETLDNPPFSKIYTIMFIEKNEKNIIIFINRLKKYLEYYNIKGNYKILGPSPSIIHKINGNYRWQILVKGKDEEKLRNFVTYTLDKLREKEALGDIRVVVS